MTDRLWRTIEAQRLDTADLLDTLTDVEWQRPSMCGSWTVHEVAAHLTLQQLRVRDAARMMAHWRGSLDRTIEDAARRRAAATPPSRLAAEIRETAGVRRPNAGVTVRDTLIDILVHGQDIALPLGRRLDMPPWAAAVAAGRILTMRWPRPMPAARRLAGYRLVAADTAWSFGAGPEVRGPAAALLLVSAGRYAALPSLSGPGATDLTLHLS